MFIFYLLLYPTSTSPSSHVYILPLLLYPPSTSPSSLVYILPVFLWHIVGTEALTTQTQGFLNKHLKIHFMRFRKSNEKNPESNDRDLYFYNLSHWPMENLTVKTRKTRNWFIGNQTTWHIYISGNFKRTIKADHILELTGLGLFVIIDSSIIFVRFDC